MFPLDVNNGDVSGIHAITVSCWNDFLVSSLSAFSQRCLELAFCHTRTHKHTHKHACEHLHNLYVHTAVIGGITILQVWFRKNMLAY